MVGQFRIQAMNPLNDKHAVVTHLQHIAPILRFGHEVVKRQLDLLAAQQRGICFE